MESIVAARFVLDSGLRWWVGTGNKIRIWQRLMASNPTIIQGGNSVLLNVNNGHSR